MVEESQHAGNIRLWFEAICKYKVEIKKHLLWTPLTSLIGGLH